MDTVIPNATAQALIDRNHVEHLKSIDLEILFLCENLFHRMGFVTHLHNIKARNSRKSKTGR